MGKRAFIWDLDGTLLNSYGIIVDSLYETYLECGIELKKEEIHEHVIRYSVSSFLMSMNEKTGKSFDIMKDRYSEISGMKKLEIQTIKNAKETLKSLSEQGAKHYVFTHRGKSTEAVLKNLEIHDYFDEIITSQEGFARKPNPEAIEYFVHKYDLDKSNTYYVGDRSIDMECAKNAGIQSILFLPENGFTEKTGYEKHVVKDLLEILRL